MDDEKLKNERYGLTLGQAVNLRCVVSALKENCVVSVRPKDMVGTPSVDISVHRNELARIPIAEDHTALVEEWLGAHISENLGGEESIEKESTTLSDLIGTMPSLFPGDVVETLEGDVGVIVEANVVLNGAPLEWWRDPPRDIKHGQFPSYALDPVPGFPRPRKSAWWVASDFRKVLQRGPVFQLMERRRIATSR